MQAPHLILFLPILSRMVCLSLSCSPLVPLCVSFISIVVVSKAFGIHRVIHLRSDLLFSLDSSSSSCRVSISFSWRWTVMPRTKRDIKLSDLVNFKLKRFSTAVVCVQRCLRFVELGSILLQSIKPRVTRSGPLNRYILHPQNSTATNSRSPVRHKGEIARSSGHCYTALNICRLPRRQEAHRSRLASFRSCRMGKKPRIATLTYERAKCWCRMVAEI